MIKTFVIYQIFNLKKHNQINNEKLGFRGQNVSNKF